MLSSCTLDIFSRSGLGEALQSAPKEAIDAFYSTEMSPEQIAELQELYTFSSDDIRAMLSTFTRWVAEPQKEHNLWVFLANNDIPFRALLAFLFIPVHEKTEVCLDCVE